MILALVGILAQPASAEPYRPAALTAAAQSSILDDRNLLLYSVQLDQLTLTDSLAAYGDPNDPLIPVGELARLLDLDIQVSADQGRITGTLGEHRVSLVVDLASGIARLGGNTIPVRPADVVAPNAEIYIRASALALILPVQFEVSGEALSIALHPTEKLPIQARLERIARLRDLSQPESDGEPAMVVRSPYRLFSPPSFDVVGELGRDTRRSRETASRYDLRFAGDLLYANLQGYVGSDDAGRPQTARFLVERRSADGALPLGATRISGGDVFTPQLPMGVRSVGGRGISFTTAPLETASVFNTIDLRGELPLGFDVELYVNDVLRSGERTPVNGRYEFLSVPLSRGVNVIRIVTYGPRGERSETVRVINVGGGQLKKGASQIEIGAVDQGRDLVEFTSSSQPSSGLVTSGLRLAGTAAYGLTNAVTLVAGAAVYPSIANDRRALGSLGIRSSVAGFAVRADLAADSTGGRAVGFGAAGQPFGVSLIFDDTEYRGGFLDETIGILSPDRQLLRHSALSVDFALPPIAGRRIPLTLRGARDEFVDGGNRWIASARTSASVFNALISSGFDYQRTTGANGEVDEQLAGNITASKFVDFKWQLRSAIDFNLLPTSGLRAVSFTADRNLSDRFSFRLGLGHAFSENPETSGQVGGVYRLPFGDLTFAGDFGLHNHDWGLSIRFAFGSLFNPTSRRYVMTSPGAASSGSAVVEAYIDRDGDGQFGSGDEPTKGVMVQGGRTDVTTDTSGTALITGVGAGPSAMLTVDTKNVPLVYVRDTPSRIKFEPRPGKVVRIPYAIQPVGEVYARFVTTEASGAVVGLSALRVRLVKSGAEPILGVTEYDGSVVFSEVPPGLYAIQLDPAQAGRLRMTLQQTPSVEVKPDSSLNVQAMVNFVH